MVMKIDKLIIIGAGGHGRVAADIADQMKIPTIKFLDFSWNNKYLTIEKNYHNTENYWDIIGKPDKATISDLVFKNFKFFVAISNNKERKSFFDLIGIENIISLIHPSSTISNNVEILNGTMISANVAINVLSKIGYGSIINTGSIIDHDCQIGNFVHIGPGVNIAGKVIIKNFSSIGLGSNIIQNISIGKNAFIGAGSLVLDNISDDVIAYGLPAKQKK